jgi:signal transduction histidine kinase
VITALVSHAAVALENTRLFREVQGERERSLQIVENMADGLLTVDAGRRVTGLNPAAECLLGRTGAEATGRLLCDLLSCGANACAGVCPTLEGLLAGTQNADQTWSPRASSESGRLLRLSVGNLNVPERGAVVLLHDVTREVELATFQREVLSTFAHELRSPLANISALAELVLDDAKGGDVPVSPKLLEMLGLQARRLANLSQRTLDAARLDAGAWRLEPRPLPLVMTVRAALQRWQETAPDRSLALTAPGENVWAWADEDAVALILDNLLDNAIKYAPRGSPLTVVLERGSPAVVCVALEDGGAPIPARERPLLFERFYRRDTSNGRKTYGYGLGLFIVRKLARAMGGDAWIEALDGTGNRFVFSLPVLEDHDEDPDRRG